MSHPHSTAATPHLGRPRRAVAIGGALAVAVSLLAACGGGSASPASGGTPNPRVVRVVAAENFWGSIAAQIGGVHAHVVSIITNPNTDPHAYEPTAGDARTLATAQLVVENGIGYDPWVPKLLAASVPPHVFALSALAALVAGVTAYLSTLFLMRYFRRNDEWALNPFGYYCMVAGLGSVAWLLLPRLLQG